MRARVSRRGTCWNNAVAESCFSTLEMARVGHENHVTHLEAIASIGPHIEDFDDTTRRHSTLVCLSPAEYESRFHSSEWPQRKTVYEFGATPTRARRKITSKSFTSRASTVEEAAS